MTTQDVYDAFLARISSDEWVLPEEDDLAHADWEKLLEIAVFRFRFPRVSLIYDDNGNFEGNVTSREVQVLATFMKHEWIKRCIASWEEIKMMYSTKDFSQANHLDKLIKLSDQVEVECSHAVGTYSRSIDNKPYDYTKWAGNPK